MTNRVHDARIQLHPILALAVVLGLLAGIVTVVASGSSAEAAGPTTLTAKQATYTFSQQPDDVMDDLPFAYVSKSQEAMFIKFDTSVIGSGKTIAAAELQLDTQTVDTTTPGVQVRPVTSDWDATTLTYANRPDRESTVLNTPVLPEEGPLSIPLNDVSTIDTTGPTAFELSYSSTDPHLSFATDGATAPKLVLTLAGTTTPTATTTPKPTTTTAAATPVDQTKPLPFDLPARSSHKKLVFAHYFPPYPISIDNKNPETDYYAKNYLLPSGEDYKFATYGGLLRDRPLGRDPIGGDWKYEDLKAEIRQAQAEGIDGWNLNILNVTGSNWDRTVRTVDAADAVGNFKIMLNLDMNSATGSAGSAAIVDKVATLAKRPSIYKLGTSDFVLGAFRAEVKSTDWWKSLIANMKSEYGLTIKFIPVLLDANNYIDNFAPISYAIGNWGMRNPGDVKGAPDYAQEAHALGAKWMSPIAVQDERPTQKIYDEAGNTEALRASWQRAIGDDADLAMLVSWNDYSENTHFAPSEGHGFSFLDISAYWMSQFQTDVAPKIVRDAVYVTHRIQKYATKPTYSHQLMALRDYNNGIQSRDTVEVLTQLTAPADITVVVGSKTYTYTASAGTDTSVFPLATGKVKATAKRSGTTIGVADSPYTVTSTPYTQDLDYYAVSSRRANP